MIPIRMIPVPEAPTKEQAVADPDAMIARMAWILVAVGRQLGHDDEKIRADVKAAIIEAMEGSKPCHEVMDVRGEPTDMVSTAGVFRLAFANFNLNRRDQVAQERWLTIVEQATATALTRTDGDFAPRTPA